MTNSMKNYEAKLCTPDEAVCHIQSGNCMGFGIGIAQPPALLEAVARRLRAGDLADLRIYYTIAMKHAQETVLADDGMGP